VWNNETFNNVARTTGAFPMCYSTTTVDVLHPQWFYVCTRADATTDRLDLFVNGISEAHASITGGSILAENQGLNIGTRSLNDQYWMDGKIDELRVSNVVQSDAWIQTEYNNMVSPATFAIFGSETFRTAGEGYGSPMDLNGPAGEWIWSSFTWRNGIIPVGTHVGWRIYYVDSTGNINSTGIRSFMIGTPTEVLLEGSCYYQNMSPVNDGSVDVINLNSGQHWQASVVENYYSLELTPSVDINAGETLRVIAKDQTHSVNVTDYTVTAAELSTKKITINPILNIWYRDLTDFPFYTASVDSGTAVGKMFLDYFVWNSSVNPEGSPSVYNQTWVYNNFTGFIVPQSWLDAGLNWYDDPTYISAYNMWLGLDWSAYMYGYNFWAHADATSDMALAQICSLMDYPVPVTLGHPVHAGAAIPAYGDYSRWMAIRGIHTNKDAYMNRYSIFPGLGGNLSNLTIYGFWVNDPAVAGVGENTYKTASEFLATYFKPMDLPGTPFEDGKYTYIVEPPAGFTGFGDAGGTMVTFGNQPSGYTASQKQAIQRAARLGKTTLVDQVISQVARESVDGILALEDRSLAGYKPVQITRVDSKVSDDYTIVVLSNGVDTVAVRLDQASGKLLEFSEAPGVTGYLAGVSVAVYNGGSPFYPTPTSTIVK
jgi:hypothetical protein